MHLITESCDVVNFYFPSSPQIGRRTDPSQDLAQTPAGCRCPPCISQARRSLWLPPPWYRSHVGCASSPAMPNATQAAAPNASPVYEMEGRECAAKCHNQGLRAGQLHPTMHKAASTPLATDVEPNGEACNLASW